MGDNLMLSEVNERLHKINYGLAKQLMNVMFKNWEKVLKNIPNLPLNSIEIEQHFGKLDIQGKNPAEAMFGILGRRGVTLNDLKTSFEAIKFEEGLKIIGYPNQPLKSSAEFNNQTIYKSLGSRLELTCHSTGFPFPKHVFHKNGHPIFHGNPLIIESLRYKFIDLIL